MLYNKIYNPITNRKVKINTKLGIKILNNYINILNGGSFSGKFREKTQSIDDDDNQQPINPCSRCHGKKDIDGQQCMECLGTGTYEMQMETLDKQFSGITLEDKDPDVSFTVPLQRHGQDLTFAQLNRNVKHNKDCFPGSLYTFGIINEEQYDIIAEQYSDGISDDGMLSILESLGSKVIFETSSFDSHNIKSLSEVITEHIATKKNYIMPIIIRTNGNYNHAILVGNDNGIPVIIDTQRTELGGKYKIMKGVDEINQYLEHGWGSYTNIIGYSIFSQLKKISTEMSKLSLID